MKVLFPVLTEFNIPFTKMRDIQKQLNQLNIDLKRCMDECKEVYTKHIERLQRERDTAIVAASQMDDPNSINAQLPPGVEISNKKVTNFQLRVKIYLKNLIPSHFLFSWLEWDSANYLLFTINVEILESTLLFVSTL